jgi:hypothetical protein
MYLIKEDSSHALRIPMFFTYGYPNDCFEFFLYFSILNFTYALLSYFYVSYPYILACIPKGALTMPRDVFTPTQIQHCSVLAGPLKFLHGTSAVLCRHSQDSRALRSLCVFGGSNSS